MIKVTEIYASIQGESSFAGLPCTFVRLTGCPLRCRWCDTAYSFDGGEAMSITNILDRVQSLGLPLVELTGGEPLAQEEAYVLVKELADSGYKVLIETGGSESVQNVDSRAHIIMDLKCPGSGMSDRNLWKNLDHLKPTDEIKFVIADRNDFDWAFMMMREYHLDERFKILCSPAFGLLKPSDLAAWMVEGKINARLNLQQHKYIWHPRAKGV